MGFFSSGAPSDSPREFRNSGIPESRFFISSSGLFKMAFGRPSVQGRMSLFHYSFTPFTWSTIHSAHTTHTCKYWKTKKNFQFTMDMMVFIFCLKLFNSQPMIFLYSENSLSYDQIKELRSKKGIEICSAEFLTRNASWNRNSAE